MLRLSGFMLSVTLRETNMHKQNPLFAVSSPAQIHNLPEQSRTMRLDQLRLLFEAGDLTRADVVPAPLEPGPSARWSCQFRRQNGATVSLDLNRKRHGASQARIFNSIDAAFSACRSVGFRVVTVHAG